jgi:cell division protein FtsL
MLSPVFDFNLATILSESLNISRRTVLILFVLVVLSAIAEVTIKHLNRQFYARLNKSYYSYEVLKREHSRLQLEQSLLLAQNSLSKRAHSIGMSLPKKIILLKKVK